MYFIGQTHIMNQLSDILPTLYGNKSGASFCIRGPSGWGKTRLALMMCNYLSGGSFSVYLGDKVNFDKSHRVHFIDEVHLMKTPEMLYPLMDSKEYVIIIATNDAAILPEALVNRCFEFIFEQYTKEELSEICRMNLKFPMQNSFVDYVVESSGGNPRVMKNLLDRLNMIMLNRPNLINSLDIGGFKGLLKDVFGIVNGMDVLCIRYMDALQNVGGTASIQTISTMLHVDQGTLKFYVEPVLLYKNKIRITSRGRSLI